MSSRSVALVALLAYGWWFTDLQPFTLPSLLALFGASIVLLAVATAHRRTVAGNTRDQRTLEAPGVVPAAIAWCIVVFALGSWELIALFSHPRSQHPTISSLLSTAQQHHALRFGVYVLWLALGWAIAS